MDEKESDLQGSEGEYCSKKVQSKKKYKARLQVRKYLVVLWNRKKASVPGAWCGDKVVGNGCEGQVGTSSYRVLVNNLDLF